MLRAFRPEASRVHHRAFLVLHARSFATEVAQDDARFLSVQIRSQSSSHPRQTRRQLGNLLRRPGVRQPVRNLRHARQVSWVT
jgi:hypothetical protein